MTGRILKGLHRVLSRTGLLWRGGEIYSFYERLHFRRSLRKMLDNGFHAPRPRFLIFEPTLRCNQNCLMCYIPKGGEMAGSELTPPQIEGIFRGIRGMGSILLIGGEVMVRGDAMEILRLFDRMGVSIHLSTNLTAACDYLDALHGLASLFRVSTSLDGPEGVNDAIRMKGSFRRVTKGMTELRKGGAILHVTCVIQDRNITHLKDMPRIVKGCGGDLLFLEYDRLYTRKGVEEAINALGLTEEDLPLITRPPERGHTLLELKEGIRTTILKGRREGLPVLLLPHYLLKDLDACFSMNLRKGGRFYCREVLRPRIDPYGNLVFCYTIRKRFGNLLERPFHEVWNSVEIRDFRKRLYEKNLTPLCETCLYMERVG